MQLPGVKISFSKATGTALALWRDTLPAVYFPFYHELETRFRINRHSQYSTLFVTLDNAQDIYPDYKFRCLKNGRSPHEWMRRFAEAGKPAVIVLDLLSARSFEEQFPDHIMGSILHPGQYKSVPYIAIPAETYEQPIVFHDGFKHQPAPSFIRGLVIGGMA